MVKNQEKSLSFVQRFFFFSKRRSTQKTSQLYELFLDFSLLYSNSGLFLYILVRSCLFLFDLVYSCLFLSCYGIVFQKQKLPYVQVSQLPKLNCWQVCWQRQEKKSKAHFLTGAIGGTMVGMSKFRPKRILLPPRSEKTFNSNTLFFNIFNQ